MQGALEVLGIPYTGSGVMASALAMDKWRTKLVWLASGIPTPRYRIVDATTDWKRVVAELGLPLFVKPAREGSTIGITKVSAADHDELALAWQAAALHDTLVLVEEFVVGRRTDGLDPRRSRAAAGPDRGAAGQLRLPQQVLLRRDAVLLPERPAGGPGAGDPARRSPPSASSAAAAGAGSTSSCAPTARSQFLEVNTSPGMTGHRLVPMAARQAGMSFAELCASRSCEARHVG